MARPFYITTPIYYINAEPHLGHAYTSMVADAIARSRRLLQDDVFFLTGTDEHGQKVERAAQKAGLDTREFADRMAAKFRGLSSLLNISNDDFIRTTEERHKRAAQAIWQRVADRGYLYKAPYEGWYCTVDELLNGMSEKPSSLVKLVGTDPAPFTVMEEPPVVVCDAVIVTPLSSGRSNSALK